MRAIVRWFLLVPAACAGDAPPTDAAPTVDSGGSGACAQGDLMITDAVSPRPDMRLHDGYVYFGNRDATGVVVSRVSIDGGLPFTMMPGPGGLVERGMVVVGDRLYANRDNLDLWSVPLSGGADDATQVADWSGVPQGIATDGTVVYSLLQPASLLEVAADGTSTTVNTVEGYFFNPTAAPHIFVYADGAIYSHGNVSASESVLLKMPVDGSPVTVFEETEFWSAGENGIDTDGVYLYWTVSNTGRLERKALSGGPVEVIVDGLSEPRAPVVYDGRIYWLDAPAGTLRSSPVEGGAVQIHACGLNLPYGLAVADGVAVYAEDATRAQPTRLWRLDLD